MNRLHFIKCKISSFEDDKMTDEKIHKAAPIGQLTFGTATSSELFVITFLFYNIN